MCDGGFVFCNQLGRLAANLVTAIFLQLHLEQFCPLACLRRVHHCRLSLPQIFAFGGGGFVFQSKLGRLAANFGLTALLRASVACFATS